MGRVKKIAGWVIGLVLIAIGIGFLVAFIPDMNQFPSARFTWGDMVLPFALISGGVVIIWLGKRERKEKIRNVKG